MPFEAVIDSQENKLLWCRCLHALAALSDDICFVFTPTRLVVSGRNTGDTTFMDAAFTRSFFKSYRFDTGGVAEGRATYNGEEAYGLTVRSKLLSMLFRKHEDEVDQFKLVVDAREDCPTNLKYRLQIDVMTKSSILKRFTPYYNPSPPMLTRLAEAYKDSLLQQKRTCVYQGTNYMMMGNAMLKGFLENAGTSTEHLRFEVNAQRFSITAFTRGVYIKEKEILKQPMAVNMQFRSEDLHALDIRNDDDINIVIRLRDFKNFLSLAHQGEVTECYFKKAGDPILFEMLKNNVTIQLVQDTDAEGHITNDQQPRVRHKPAAAAPPSRRAQTDESLVSIRSTNKRLPSAEQEQEQEPLFVQDEEQPDHETYQDDGGMEVPSLPPSPTYPQPPTQSQEEERITWGDPASETLSLKRLMNTRKQIIEDSRSQYLESIKKQKLEKKQQESKDQTPESDELGPTQNVPKVKGLFG